MAFKTQGFLPLFSGLSFPLSLGASEPNPVLCSLSLRLAARAVFAHTPKIHDLAHFKPRQAAWFPPNRAEFHELRGGRNLGQSTMKHDQVTTRLILGEPMANPPRMALL
jgi:hypothetical protein